MSRQFTVDGKTYTVQWKTYVAGRSHAKNAKTHAMVLEAGLWWHPICGGSSGTFGGGSTVYHIEGETYNDTSPDACMRCYRMRRTEDVEVPS